MILPVDPLWKQSYAASVRRLIRDGVETPLATLFLRATRLAVDRPEEVPRTAGKFCLNGELPIPFDGRGRMEVDLLAAEMRLAIEVDGAQHLEPEAYRRDRRKDLLLQENGYLVLRFLAEDIGTRLDEVLDAIERASVHRRNLGER